MPPPTPPDENDEARRRLIEMAQRDRTIDWLHAEVAQRDQTVTWLHAEVARRDALLASLGASVGPPEGARPEPPPPAGARRPELAVLGTLYGTDKVEHGYLPYYAHHFERFRDGAANLIEIGIREGRSLRMWRDYFSTATIHGVDIQDCDWLAEPRIRIHRGDQTDAELLRRVAAQAAPLDIVIDDGSHMNRDVLASFAVLFPLLKSGGLYAIEDMHTSYWSKYGGDHRNLDTGRTSASFIKNLIDGLNCHWIPGRRAGEFDRSIAGVHCYPKIAFICKGRNDPVLRPYELRMMQASLAPPDEPAS